MITCITDVSVFCHITTFRIRAICVYGITDQMEEAWCVCVTVRGCVCVAGCVCGRVVWCVCRRWSRVTAHRRGYGGHVWYTMICCKTLI